LLLSTIEKYRLSILEVQEDEDIQRLAKQYIDNGAVPSKKWMDALHLAISTIHEMDILLSWNFKHLANINKQMAISAINERQGYLKKLNLLTPLGVEYEP
jgi:hypothetical protein